MAEHHRFAWRTWTRDREHRLFKGSDEFARILRAWKGDEDGWQIIIGDEPVDWHPYLPSAKTLGIMAVKKRLAAPTAPEKE